MKRKLLVALSVVLVCSLLLAFPAHAADTPYGQVFAIRQPLIVDWSAYASYGFQFKVTLTDLTTKKAQTLNSEGEKSGKVSSAWTVCYFEKKASYSVAIEVLDSGGNTVKTVTDYFHIGSAVVTPPAEPAEKLNLIGVTVGDASAPAVMSKAMFAALSNVKAANPAFAAANCDGIPSLWFNNRLNTKYALDAVDIMRKRFNASAYKYDPALEADLFKRMNEYRAQNSKAAIVWSNNIARVVRLRGTVLSNFSLNADKTLPELDGDFARNIVNYGLSTPQAACTGWMWSYTGSSNWSKMGQKIFEEILNNADFKSELTQDFKYGSVGIVKSSRMFTEKKSGIIVMIVLSN